MNKYSHNGFDYVNKNFGREQLASAMKKGSTTKLSLNALTNSAESAKVPLITSAMFSNNTRLANHSIAPTPLV